MQLSYPLQYSGNPRETADQVVELEQAGLDMVWVAEAYGFDSPTLMGYLAAKTERLQIAAGILNVFSRTPGAILQTAAGLDNVSAGRAVLGLLMAMARSICFSWSGLVPAGTLMSPDATARSSSDVLSAIERSDSDSEPRL